MPLNALDAQALGDIINDLNPYFDARVPPPRSWQMDINTGTAAVPIRVELDSRYSGDWTFGGQPQKIARAIRIRYRYPVQVSSGPAAGTTYWLEDYLLIGYEGAGAG